MTEALVRPPPGAARIAGMAGIAGIAIPSVALLLVPIWDFPATGTSPGGLVEFVTAHQHGLQATMVLYTVGVTLWAVFGAAAWAQLRATLPPSGRTAALLACFAAGLVGFVTLLLAGFTAFDVLVYRPSADDAQVLYDLAFGLLAMSGMPTAVALGSYALLVRAQPVVPRWAGVLAGITALAHIALLVSFVVPRGFLSLEGQVITAVPALLWAWILGTAIAMARTR